MSKVKLGFVGTGFMGQKAHLSNYVALEDCEIVAIAEPRTGLAKKVAERYGIQKVYSSHTELLNQCEVDAIVAAQPYTHHITLIPDILKAGKHVLTEKPLSLSIEAGEELVKLADENRVLYMVGYHKRSDPAMEYGKKVIEAWKASGEYGKLKYVRITMPPGDWVGGAGGALSSDEPYPSIITEKDVPYFSEKGSAQYNSFVNYYIHQVNAMRFLLGEPYKLTFADRSGVMLAVESNSGVCGVLEMAPYSNTTDWQEAMLVCFEQGYVRVELPSPLAAQQAGCVTILEDNGKGTPRFVQPIMPRISAMRNQASNFLAAVRGEKAAPCDAREALEDLKIAKEYIALMMK